jgi:uncharacterized protein YbaR (Trm112 family)
MEARKRTVRPGEEHYFCPKCRERLAIIEDKRGPDGEGPYFATWEPGTVYDPEMGKWVRLRTYRGLARGRNVRRRLAVPPGSPEEAYVEGVLEAYTSGRRPLRVKMPPGTHTIACRCRQESTISNPSGTGS